MEAIDHMREDTVRGDQVQLPLSRRGIEKVAEVLAGAIGKLLSIELTFSARMPFKTEVEIVERDLQELADLLMISFGSTLCDISVERDVPDNPDGKIDDVDLVVMLGVKRFDDLCHMAEPRRVVMQAEEIADTVNRRKSSRLPRLEATQLQVNVLDPDARDEE